MSNIDKQALPDLREKFERWWEVNYHNGNPPRFGWEHWRDGNSYKIDDDESELDGMWESWKAAHSSKLEAAEKRVAEQEALEENAAMSDIDMSDADCFTSSRLIEIIYGSKLKWPEEKLLARFMHDIKQRRGSRA
jgi:hypothetical protein